MVNDRYFGNEPLQVVCQFYEKDRQLQQEISSIQSLSNTLSSATSILAPYNDTLDEFRKAKQDLLGEIKRNEVLDIISFVRMRKAIHKQELLNAQKKYQEEIANISEAAQQRTKTLVDQHLVESARLKQNIASLQSQLDEQRQKHKRAKEDKIHNVVLSSGAEEFLSSEDTMHSAVKYSKDAFASEVTSPKKSKKGTSRKHNTSVDSIDKRKRSLKRPSLELLQSPIAMKKAKQEKTCGYSDLKKKLAKTDEL